MTSDVILQLDFSNIDFYHMYAVNFMHIFMTGIV